MIKKPPKSLIWIFPPILQLWSLLRILAQKFGSLQCFDMRLWVVFNTQCPLMHTIWITASWWQMYHCSTWCRRVSLISKKKNQHFFSGSYWRCHRSHWHQSELFWKCHTLSKLVGHCEFTHWLTSRPLKMKGKSLIKGKYTAFYKKNQIVWKSPKKSH